MKTSTIADEELPVTKINLSVCLSIYNCVCSPAWEQCSKENAWRMNNQAKDKCSGGSRGSSLGSVEPPSYS